MFIDNINISAFGASCTKKYIQPSVIGINKEKLGVNTIKLSKKTDLKNIYTKLLFEGEDRDAIEKNISNFMSKLQDEVDIRFNNLSSIFHVYIIGSDKEYTEFDEWIYLNLEFEGYEYAEVVNETINKITSKIINVKGNTETTAIVEITPISDLIDIRLDGFGDDPIIIKNLKANKKVIIDGENQKVTVDGFNKFSDTDLWEFPKLVPGSNTIKISRNSCDITIKYKPMFI